MICNKCSTSNLPQSKFCSKCGSPLKEVNKNFYDGFDSVCNCENILKPRERYCNKCNTWYPFTKEQTTVTAIGIKHKNNTRLIASERQINLSENVKISNNKSQFIENNKQTSNGGNNNYKVYPRKKKTE